MPTGLAAGSRIATPHGFAAIEDLQPGDAILGPHRIAQNVMQISLMACSERHLAETPWARPVRIQAGALGRDLPHHDVMLASNTTVLVPSTGVATPAWLLVNGRSVVRAPAEGQVRYYQIKRATSLPLLVGGALCDLAPPANLEPSVFCARARVASLAGAPPGPTEGMIDHCDRASLRGWARNLSAPDFPLALEVRVNGRRAGFVIADIARQDLLKGGKGACAFAFTFPRRLSAEEAHLIELRRADSKLPLGISGVLLDRIGGLDQALRALRPDSLPALRDTLRRVAALAA